MKNTTKYRFTFHSAFSIILLYIAKGHHIYFCTAVQVKSCKYFDYIFYEHDVIKCMRFPIFFHFFYCLSCQFRILIYVRYSKFLVWIRIFIVIWHQIFISLLFFKHIQCTTFINKTLHLKFLQ